MKSTNMMQNLHRHFNGTRQRGVTLIELMVGITIGLLTIAVAIGSLMVSRGVSGTVSDATQIQQQAAYAFRVMGQQMRQAGSVRLNLAANQPAGAAIGPADVVAFETSFDGINNTVRGLDSPSAAEFALRVGYQNYTESSFTSAAPVSLFRDCLGSQPDPTIVQSQFSLRNAELVCAGSNNVAQSIIKNVAAFQVLYLIQANAATGSPSVRRVNAATASGDWSQVFGVEVCLELYGDEIIDMPAGSSYNGCANAAAIDMTNAAVVGANRRNRLHMTFRNVYQLRSQGLAG